MEVGGIDRTARILGPMSERTVIWVLVKMKMTPWPNG